MTKHLTDIELFELANDLVTNADQKTALLQHITTCESCALQLSQEKQLDELLSNKLMVNQMVDVSDKVSQHFSLKEFSKAPDIKWVINTILILVSILTSMELVDVTSINIAEHFNANYIHYMRIILSATTLLLFIDVFVKFMKYRKQLL